MGNHCDSCVKTVYNLVQNPVRLSAQFIHRVFMVTAKSTLLVINWGIFLCFIPVLSTAFSTRFVPIITERTGQLSP